MTSNSTDTSLADLPLAAWRRLSPKSLMNAVVLCVCELVAVYGLIALCFEAGRMPPLWAASLMLLLFLTFFCALGLLIQTIRRTPLLIIDHDVFWSRSNLRQPMPWSRVAGLSWRIGPWQVDGVFLDLRTALQRGERPIGPATMLAERLYGKTRIYIPLKNLQISAPNLARLIQAMAERHGAVVEPLQTEGRITSLLGQVAEQQALRLARK